VPGILADADDQGHVKLLLHLLQDDSRRDIWDFLQCATPSFADLGLAHDTSDLLIWQTCQQHQLILVTANRTAKTEDSLEVTIRSCNTPDSLPVITLANPQRMLRDKHYAHRVADRVLAILFDIDRYRGTGRLFVP
jgi:hypothetical protein